MEKVVPEYHETLSFEPIQLDVKREYTEGEWKLELKYNQALDCLLYWGLMRGRNPAWAPPEQKYWPHDSKLEKGALQTPFARTGGGQELTIKLPAEDAPQTFAFLLYDPKANRWLKHNGGDAHIPLSRTQQELPERFSPPLEAISGRIIEAETVKPSWTLMHRFNLCHEFMATAADLPAALPLLFGWLRYSAIRQLDWQRNYNTKPSELSAAQDRLTRKIAEIWLRCSQGRVWLRLLLDTLGRGGEGQRVRDEILHIMHRNQIQEVRGLFMEEWHQKLHNNTTTDDVVICEAYLAFLNSNGNLNAFYETLQRGGVSRERLRSYERPITVVPKFMPERNNALVGDFENFLRVLKSVHRGADLDSAAPPARHWLMGQ